MAQITVTEIKSVVIENDTLRRLTDAINDVDLLEEVENQLRYGESYDEDSDAEVVLADHIYKHIEALYEEQDRKDEEDLQRRIDEGNWSDNQRAFISEAREKGLRVFLYSGRGMFGAECPAAKDDYLSDDDFESDVYTDSMGYGVVCYARG